MWRVGEGALGALVQEGFEGLEKAVEVRAVGGDEAGGKQALAWFVRHAAWDPVFAREFCAPSTIPILNSLDLVHKVSVRASAY